MDRMSEETRPQPVTTASAAYLAQLTGYVKDKDPVAVQEATPAQIAELVASAAPEQLRLSPAPGKWSIVSIVAHLAEIEIANSWRYRQILEKDGVTLLAFDQDLWAKWADYEHADLEESLQRFRLLRAANVRLFRNLTAADWQRSGTHVERGPLTLELLVTQMAGHDVHHMEQIRAMLHRSAAG